MEAPSIAPVVKFPFDSIVLESAAACPDCAVGREARSQVLDEDFAHHFAIALLPFAIVMVLCWRLERWGARRS